MQVSGIVSVVDTKSCRLHTRRPKDFQDLLDARDKDAPHPELTRRCVELRAVARAEVMRFVLKLKEEVGKGLAGDLEFVEEALKRREKIYHHHGVAIREYVEGCGARLEVPVCGTHAWLSVKRSCCLVTWARGLDHLSMLAVVEPAMCGDGKMFARVSFFIDFVAFLWYLTL